MFFMKKVLIGLFLGLFCCGAYSQTEVIDKDVQIGGLLLKVMERNCNSEVLKVTVMMYIL